MTPELWKIEWLNSEYPEAGWHAFGAIPPMPIAEAVEMIADYVQNNILGHLNWRLVNIDTGEEISGAIL